MYTAINAIRLFGPYMVIFKTRSIERIRYPPIPARLAQRHAVIKHTFSNTYRNYAMSGPDNSGLPSTTFSLFASDLIQGLFHYTIHISLNTMTSHPPFTLNGRIRVPSYNARFHYHQRSTVASYSRKSTVTDTLGLNKGFVSAYSLGTQACAGVDGTGRENMLREVVAARLHSEDIMELEEAYHVPDIEATVVREMRSVDLKARDVELVFVLDFTSFVIKSNSCLEEGEWMKVWTTGDN
ncbi:hypothetical protein CPB85DRAFT_1262969 [Mucidula mucida]|nr:hypothetical protein CPB85DRAFT_1262969 [Mucidula mucida]